MREFSPFSKPGDPELLANLLRRNTGNIHMLGICGIGMAGLALLLKHRGFNVSGCDTTVNSLSERLTAARIPVCNGHAPDHLQPDTHCVIMTPAVDPESPEPRAAALRGIPVFTRGTVLPRLLENRDSVAVAGTHGKTTTSTFIAQVLRHAGRDPAWCIGGVSAPLDHSPAGTGAGNAIVVEADESDGTLALYHPAITVITNIEFDHMEHFDSVAAFEECFRSVIRNTTRRVIYCADDPRAAALCAATPRTRSYGLAPDASLSCTDVRLGADSVSFTPRLDGEKLEPVQVPAPGAHNVLNALATIAACLELGLSPSEIRLGLASVTLPRRRLERVAESDGITVISDYAHHPTEIRALVRAIATTPHNRLLAVFQPHRYTRTAALGPDFPAAFAGIHKVILTPVYAASEKPVPGGQTWDLYARFVEPAAHRTDNRHQQEIILADSLEQAWHHIRTQLRPGDILLVIGAGSVERIALWAAEHLAERARNLQQQATLNDLAIPPLFTPNATNPPVSPKQTPAQQHTLPDFRNNPLALQDAFVRFAPRLTATTLSFDVPLARRTTLCVGGAADLFMTAESRVELAAIVRWAHKHHVPLRVLGAGSKILIPDTGLPGMTVALAGREFAEFRIDGETVTAGAAVPIAALLAKLTQAGLGGLEFMEAIPASIGGAVRMNAGAWGHSIGERLLWIQRMDPDGSIHTINRPDLSLAYRRCATLDYGILLEAGFTLSTSNPTASRAIRTDYAERRAWMRGKRSAGSVFKNPPDRIAGKLLDELQFKGRSIGGAEVCRSHANIIVTHDGATASDVATLVHDMRHTVRNSQGIDLETELIYFDQTSIFEEHPV